MAKEAILQIKMDADLKQQAEELYQALGTSFAEAVRIFARKSVQEKALPFQLQLTEQKIGTRIGIAKGKFTAPEDIDKYNDEIADMFGGI